MVLSCSLFPASTKAHSAKGWLEWRFLVAIIPVVQEQTTDDAKRCASDSDSGGLDDGFGFFQDRLVGAEDGLPDDRAEDTA